MKIESEKAQVRISSLSNFQSFVSIVVYNKDMKIERRHRCASRPRVNTRLSFFVLCSNDMKIKANKHRCASRPCVCNICQRHTSLSNCQSFIYSCVQEGHEDGKREGTGVHLVPE